MPRDGYACPVVKRLEIFMNYCSTFGSTVKPIDRDRRFHKIVGVTILNAAADDK